ncbi:MAG: ferrous iron transport protein A [Methanothrix sp.]|nr:ferrous iron transport protein A [Methanothrix sp.]OPX74370.1 MAG: FeoA domain protein [Methanosaeta sp. PtaB.Bin018]OPY45962.1 MAG: FeoA domain protein [Methanosaeta sp. PtaU1.Bin016]HOV52121.1 FeoA family protein [Methanothrix sp.]
MNSSGSVSGGCLPLAFLPEGTEGIVLEVQGGQGVTRHLEDMGFSSHARVKVLKSCPPGAMLVMVKDSRIALGRGMAMKILVKNIEE